MSDTIREKKRPRVKQIAEGPEAKVKKAIKSVLAHWGAWYHMPIPPGNARTLDFICCVPITITPEMVGRTVGLFVSIEAKKEYVDEPTQKQQLTMDAIRRANGIAYLVNVTDENGINRHLTSEVYKPNVKRG